MCSKDGGWGGGRAERIVFSVSNDRILFAGGRHVCICVYIHRPDGNSARPLYSIHAEPEQLCV